MALACAGAVGEDAVATCGNVWTSAFASEPEVCGNATGGDATALLASVGNEAALSTAWGTADATTDRGEVAGVVVEFAERATAVVGTIGSTGLSGAAT